MINFDEVYKKAKYMRNKEMLDTIKTVIEHYCRERKMIIYGGLALDKLLRQKTGKGIYGNYEMVDYDVYSANYLQDSEDLAKALNSHGIPYIKVHSGFKPTTRKIHITTLSTSVIDINYVSEEKYKTLYPVEIDGLLYIRPDALYEDQIKNLCTNLFVDHHRIPKIVKRLPIILENFPVIAKENRVTKDVIPVETIPEHGILAGDYAFNYYMTGKFEGKPILYSDIIPDNYPYLSYDMEGITAYYLIDGHKIATKALLLYLYFKFKIEKNTDEYDYQIWALTSEGFPFVNYKAVSYYYPIWKEPKKWEYHKTIHLD